MDIAVSEFLGFLNLSWQAVVMLLIAGVLIWLGITHKVEPVLLIPIGVGCMLANIPLGGTTETGGFLAVLRDAGIHTEIFPLLIFIGIGAMIDFEPFLQRPYTIFLGAAAQFGIFGTFFLAYWLGAGGLNLLDFSLNDAAAIGIIGSLMDPLPFMSPLCYNPNTRLPSWWQPIHIWLWFPLSSHPSSKRCAATRKGLSKCP